MSAEWSSWLYTMAGVLLILSVGYDVYTIVLHARGRSGPISDFISRRMWQAARVVSFRFPRKPRHRLLNVVGPFLLPLLIGLFIVLLIFAFALIYYPRMPAEFNVESAAASPRWIESIYLSGTTLVTIGYGDIAPRTISMRLVALAEGVCGMAMISLMVTYLLTIYGALERKRTVALHFYHQAGEGADVAGFLAHYFVDGRFRRLATTLGAAARDLQRLLESHLEHPIIHYFHPVEVYKSLPRMLFLALEICTVIRSCLRRESYSIARDDPEVRLLYATSHHVLARLNEALHPGRAGATVFDQMIGQQKRWRLRFEDTLARLAEVGIETERGVEQAWDEYRASRAEWEPGLRRFAAFLGYDWEEITGDLDLQYAADEEQEEPQVGVNV